MQVIAGDGVPAKLLELATDPQAVFVAFDDTGATSVEAPPDLADRFDRVWLADSPMDPLDPSSVATAVALFDAARRGGSASGLVRVRSLPGSDFRLWIFDLTATHDCFGGVVVPADSRAGLPPETDDGPTMVPKHMVLGLDVHGVIVEVDDAATVALGWTREEMVGRSALELLHPADHERGIAMWADVLRVDGAVRRLRQRFLRRDGRHVWMEVTETNRLAEQGQVVTELIDIDDEMAALEALRQREELLAQLADALPTGVMQVDGDGQIEFSNRRWYEILDLDRNAGPEALLEMVDRVTHRAILTRMAVVRDTGLPAELDIAVTTPRGDELTCRLLLRHLEESRPGSVLVTLEDITERHRLQRNLVAQAAQDPLTGLLNRTALMQHLDAHLAEDPDGMTGVLFVDLDGFKAVNDTHGHAVGDRLLCDVGRIIGDRVRDDDLVGRLGGDEFVVVAPNLPDRALASDLAHRISYAVALLAGTDDVGVTASVGWALSTEHDSAERLLAAADAAMYEQKRRKHIRALV